MGDANKTMGQKKAFWIAKGDGRFILYCHILAITEFRGETAARLTASDANYAIHEWLKEGGWAGPGAVESAVKELKAERDDLIKGRDRMKEDIQKMYLLGLGHKERADWAFEALEAVKSQCAGHADEFSRNVWAIAEKAIGGGGK